MKKILCLFLMAAFLVGCSNSPVKGATVLEKDDICIMYQMPNDNNGIEAVANKYSSWFNISGDELKNIINEKAAEKDYKALELLDSSSDTQHMLSYNGDTWYVLVNMRDNTDGYQCVSKVKLSLYSDSDETSKRNGDYLYFLMDIFSPGKKEDICKILGIFDEPNSDLPDMRQLLIGNTIYTYIKNDSSSDEFSIKSFAQPVETPKQSSAIKPE